MSGHDSSTSVTPTPIVASSFFSEVVEGRRGEILDAAVAVFAEKGYVGGTMRDIATRVGVTEPALYRHFSSKQDIFDTMLATAAGRMRDEALALLDSLDADDVRASLLAAMADRRQALRRYSPVLSTMVVAASHDPASLKVLRETVILPVLQRVSQLIRDVDAKLGLDRDDTARAAALRSFVSLFVGTMVTSAVMQEVRDHEMVDSMMRLLGWSA